MLPDLEARCHKCLSYELFFIFSKSSYLNTGPGENRFHEKGFYSITQLAGMLLNAVVIASNLT